ncbi:hypothetical protein [Scytonema sp. NUACC21]
MTQLRWVKEVITKDISCVSFLDEESGQVVQNLLQVTLTFGDSIKILLRNSESNRQTLNWTLD